MEAGATDSPLPRSAIKISASVRSFLGHDPVKIYSENRGKAQVILVKGASDAKKMLAMKNLIDGTEIKVSIHPTANKIRGVIHSFDVIDDSESELKSAMETQGVIDVYRLRKNGTNTPICILTFSGTQLPENIKVEHTRIKVRPYYPKPLQCFKCWKFGHTGKQCKDTEHCGNCYTTEHNGKNTNCTATSFCVTCVKNDHPSYSKKCPTFTREQGVIKLKIDRNLTYPEAKRLWDTENKQTNYAKITADESQKASIEKLLAIISAKDIEIEKMKNSPQPAVNTETDKMISQLKETTERNMAFMRKQMEEQNKKINDLLEINDMLTKRNETLENIITKMRTWQRPRREHEKEIQTLDVPATYNENTTDNRKRILEEGYNKHTLPLPLDNKKAKSIENLATAGTSADITLNTNTDTEKPALHPRHTRLQAQAFERGQRSRSSSRTTLSQK